MNDAGDVWLEDGFADDTDMLGLALCECGLWFGACIEPMLNRLLIEAESSEAVCPYCCWG